MLLRHDTPVTATPGGIASRSPVSGRLTAVLTGAPGMGPGQESRSENGGCGIMAAVPSQS
jgi:hypothetical protein